MRIIDKGEFGTVVKTHSGDYYYSMKKLDKPTLDDLSNMVPTPSLWEARVAIGRVKG